MNDELPKNDYSIAEGYTVGVASLILVIVYFVFQ